MSTETTAAGMSGAALPAPLANPSSQTIPAGIQEKVKPLERELLTYFRELPRLLQAGAAGRHALIRGEEIVGIWDTWNEAIQIGRERYGMEPVCVKQIDPQDADRLARLKASEEAQCRLSEG